MDVLKDGIASWEKRMGSDNEDHDMSTNEAYRNDNLGSHSDSEDDAPGVDDEGVREEDMWVSYLPRNSEQMKSDARGPPITIIHRKRTPPTIAALGPMTRTAATKTPTMMTTAGTIRQHTRT